MNNTQKHTSSGQNQGSSMSVEDDFFIPDLCNTRSVIILVIASELFAIIVSLVTHSLPVFNWMNFVLISLLIQWITLSSAAIICGMRPWLRNMAPSSVLLICASVVLIDTAVFSVIGEWVAEPGYTRFPTPQTLDYWSVIKNMLIGAIISGMVFRYFLVQHQLRVKERAELTARLQSLQSRIRPHFLFNSMNIIASLIATNPQLAETVVEDLAELFRASLKEAKNLVTLRTEIELCKKYSRIEQLRLGSRLAVNWHEKGLDDELYDQIDIPLLLIQPLLENAIYHGVQPRAEGGEINITLENQSGDGDVLKVTIVNPLPEAGAYTTPEKQHKGNKMALENIRHRLLAIYGDKGKLDQFEENNEFVTVLSFPKKAPDYD